MRLRAQLASAMILAIATAGTTKAEVNDVTKQLAHDILQQLVEIDRTDSVGTKVAAEAMEKRLRDAGFSKDELYLGGMNAAKMNLVAQIHGTGAYRPVLLVGSLDVAETRQNNLSTDPVGLVEKDGYFYGRGILNRKAADAVLITMMVWLKRQHYQPDRDIIVALTADGGYGTTSGFDWLLKNHRDLIDADFVISLDGGSFELEGDRRLLVGVEVSEKLSQDFELMVTGKGGSSSLPLADNSIYHLIDGLTHLEHYSFPFELDETTRAYFEKMSEIAGDPQAADMKAILRKPPDSYAAGKISRVPFYNGITHTTCVATSLDSEHTTDALPQTAKATVNCRILPGRTSDQVRRILLKILDEPEITVTPIVGFGGELANPASPLRPDVMNPLEKVSSEMWPGVPVVPMMGTRATVGRYSRAAGIPTYGISGMWVNPKDSYTDGPDERIPVESLYDGVDFFCRFTMALASR
jgi:acetylornithine deacetylase/succinyl-diaminopimelate desuccinylase-like protein